MRSKLVKVFFSKLTSSKGKDILDVKKRLTNLLLFGKKVKKAI